MNGRVHLLGSVKLYHKDTEEMNSGNPTNVKGRLYRLQEELHRAR